MFNIYSQFFLISLQLCLSLFLPLTIKIFVPAKEQMTLRSHHCHPLCSHCWGKLQKKFDSSCHGHHCEVVTNELTELTKGYKWTYCFDRCTMKALQQTNQTFVKYLYACNDVECLKICSCCKTDKNPRIYSLIYLVTVYDRTPKRQWFTTYCHGSDRQKWPSLELN